MTPKQKLIEEILEELDKEFSPIAVYSLSHQKAISLALSKQTEQFLKILDEKLKLAKGRLATASAEELSARMYLKGKIDFIEDLKQKLKERIEK